MVGTEAFVSEEAETFFLVKVALHFYSYFPFQTIWNWWAQMHLSLQGWLLAGVGRGWGPRQLPGRGGWLCCAGLWLRGVCREMSPSHSAGASGAVVLGAECDLPQEDQGLCGRQRRAPASHSCGWMSRGSFQTWSVALCRGLGSGARQPTE